VVGGEDTTKSSPKATDAVSVTLAP
jgi:hypothetical protein